MYNGYNPDNITTDPTESIMYGPEGQIPIPK